MKASGYNPNRTESVAPRTAEISRATQFFDRLSEVTRGKTLDGAWRERYTTYTENGPVVRDYDVGTKKPIRIATVYIKQRPGYEALYAVLTSKHHLEQLKRDLPPTVRLDETLAEHLPLLANENLQLFRGTKADSLSEKEEIYRLTETSGQPTPKAAPAHRTLQ